MVREHAPDVKPDHRSHAHASATQADRSTANPQQVTSMSGTVGMMGAWKKPAARRLDGHPCNHRQRHTTTTHPRGLKTITKELLAPQQPRVVV